MVSIDTFSGEFLYFYRHLIVALLFLLSFFFFLCAQKPHPGSSTEMSCGFPLAHSGKTSQKGYDGLDFELPMSAINVRSFPPS